MSALSFLLFIFLAEAVKEQSQLVSWELAGDMSVVGFSKDKRSS